MKDYNMSIFIIFLKYVETMNQQHKKYGTMMLLVTGANYWYERKTWIKIICTDESCICYVKF